MNKGKVKGKEKKYKPARVVFCKYCGTAYAIDGRWSFDIPYVCEDCELIVNAGAL